MKVIIGKKVTVKEAPMRVSNEIKETLTVLNPKWLENDRLGRWNRGTPQKLFYFDAPRQKELVVPRGFAYTLIPIAKKHGVPIEWGDERRQFDPIPYKFHGKLKDFQVDATEDCLKRDWSVLCAPTGSGKTVMGLWMIAKRQQPTMVIVHNKELMYQWVERAKRFLGIPKDMIGLTGDGHYSVNPDGLNVGIVNSVYTKGEKISPHIGFYLVDECHRTPSRTFIDATTLFDAKYSLGLTATPYRRDSLHRLIFWYLGPMAHQVPTDEIMAQGHIIPIEVIVHDSDFVSEYSAKEEYPAMLSDLTSNAYRNSLVVDDVAKEVRNYPEGTCLVLSDRKEHCAYLKALLEDRHSIPSMVLTGDTKKKERAQIVEMVTAGKVKVLIATGQLIGEGFDCGELSSLFIATPISFKGRLIQYVGRVLRPAKGKLVARIHEYVDNNIGQLVNQFRKRCIVYRREYSASI